LWRRDSETAVALVQPQRPLSGAGNRQPSAARALVDAWTAAATERMHWPHGAILGVVQGLVRATSIRRWCRSSDFEASLLCRFVLYLATLVGRGLPAGDSIKKVCRSCAAHGSGQLDQAAGGGGAAAGVDSMPDESKRRYQLQTTMLIILRAH
jgi:hypothetical protein